MAKPTYKTDPLYQALKKALAVCKTDKERGMVQSAITATRHEFAWADPESPLEEIKFDAIPGGERFP